jgi:hypothetical protein
MTTYILLRDNKESIPLSLTDLKNLGLKPTDLIWVEGQSVCWMHPGQIKELKEVGLPPVETKLPETSLMTEEAIPVNEPVQAYTPDPVMEEPKKQEPEVVTKAVPAITVTDKPKKVFVELPHKEKQQESVIPVIGQKQKSFTSVNDSFPLAETKYSKPLDEIKELYLENMEKQKQRVNSRFQIPPQIKKAALYFVLFLTGIGAGLIINKMVSHKNAFASAGDTRTAGTESIKSEIYQPADSTTEYSNMPAENNSMQSTPVSGINHEKAYQEAYKNLNESKETTSVSSNILPDPAPVETVAEPVKVEEVKEIKKPSIKEIYSQVAVKNNDYTVGSFGGIKNLELTVSNHSRYSLDEVEVTVQYLKPGDELIKSETISVKGIGPGASKTIPVKKTNRGVKVVTKVSSIESKDFMNSTAGL